MSRGVMLNAVDARAQNAVMSYPPASDSSPRLPSALPRAYTIVGLSRADVVDLDPQLASRRWQEARQEHVGITHQVTDAAPGHPGLATSTPMLRLPRLGCS